MSGQGNDARPRATRGSAFTYRAAQGWDTRERDAAAGRAEGLNIGWTVFGYLISGMLAYGGIGWLIGRAVHVALLFPVGMLVGLAISIGFIIYRYGKQGAVARPSPRGGGLGGSSPRASTEGDDR